MGRPSSGKKETSRSGSQSGDSAASTSRPTGPAAWWKHFLALLATDVDGGSLALLRICFGAVMVLEAFSLLAQRPTGGSRLEMFVTGKHLAWHFPYHGFEWAAVLPEPWMSCLCWLLGVAGFFLAVGLVHRLAAAIVFLTWTYLFRTKDAP